MNQNRVHIIQEFLINQMNFLIFYPLGITVSTLFQDLVPFERPSMLIWLLGGLVPFACYFLRRKVKRFIPLVLLHLLAVGMLVILSQFLSPMDSAVNSTYFTVVGIGFLINSISLRLTSNDFKDKNITLPVAVGFAAVPLYLQHNRGSNTWDFYYIITLILVIACYFINSYLSEYLNFLTVNVSSSGILPEKEIFNSGLRLTLLYTVGSGVILLCTSQFSWLKNFIFSFLQLLVWGLTFLFSLFPSDGTEELSIKANNPDSSGDGMLFGETVKTGSLWEVLEVFLIIAVCILILVATFFALRNLITFIFRMMGNRGSKYENRLTENSVDVREKCEITKNTTSGNRPFNFFIFWDPKEKIRKIYQKHVLAFAKERPEFYTAREMEERMESGAFAALYEKARYSDEFCTSQDVKQMREACK